jgi:hypothetical protein
VKVLLDENVPHALRNHLGNHEVWPAVHMGFGGYKNGVLLKAAEGAGFDVLVTGDKTLEYEQNMAGRKIAVVALSANSWRIIKNHVAKIAAGVDAAQSGKLIRVECGTFMRTKRPPGPALG